MSGGARRWFTDAKGTRILLRPYRPEDFEALVAMYEAYTDADRSFGTPPRKRVAIESWIEDLTADGENYLACHEERPVGHVTLSPMNGRAELSVYVHPEYFDRGIGTALCEHAVEQTDYDALWLVVERDNPRAVNVFRRVGFEETAYHPGDIEMELRFTPGDEVMEDDGNSGGEKTGNDENTEDINDTTNGVDPTESGG